MIKTYAKNVTFDYTDRGKQQSHSIIRKPEKNNGSTSRSACDNTNSSSTTPSTTSLLRSIFDAVKQLNTKVDKLAEEQKKIKSMLFKSTKIQSQQFEVRKGSYEYVSNPSL